jgi:dihydrofolate reductase
MAVRVDLNLSLDGVAATVDETAQNVFGEDWGRLVAPYTATRTFRERVLHDDTGAGTTGVDDRYAQAYFEGVGAEIMGAGMFGFHTYPDNPDWRGWWGEEPPFRCPVLVLTHTERPLEEARSLAGAGDIRIGGGVSTARAFLAEGLVDRLHVGLTPIILGVGPRLWDGLHGLEKGYEVSSEVAESGVTHVTFRR